MSDSFIIAIDLGTAFSSYAYALTPRDRDIDIKTRRWGTELGLDTPKVPTCVLFDQNQTFQSFGYQARDAYIRMKAAEAKQCYYFEHFKMSLYGKRATKDLSIPAVNGKTMKALTVFTAALRFLKEDALKTISAPFGKKKFLASDFTWVLTVPAIWDNSAKQFMREAATQAEIVSKDSEEKLLIALEPEAASIWCKKLPAEGFLSDNHSRTALQQTPGTRYIVVDCGGGTIDITVHEVLLDGTLKELHKASGNDMGGQTVDKKFKEFLKEIFSRGVWDEFEAKHPGEAQKLMYDFTFMKQVDMEASFPCPHNLVKTAIKKKPLKRFFSNIKGASWSDGSVEISQEKMRSFFEESLKGITNSLWQILKKKIKIKYILLVGGYALCEVLRKHIEDEFAPQFVVLCPHMPQEVVLKGAVMFGKERAIIASRKSAFTYGYSYADKFDSSKHREQKKYTNSKGEWCTDLFGKLVEIDQDIRWNETKEYVFNPGKANQTEMRIRFFRTEREDPTYIDESDVEEIGEFVVDMSDTTGGLDRKVKMEIIFGQTEITATATDMLTNSNATVSIDFIANKDIRDNAFKCLS